MRLLCTDLNPQRNHGPQNACTTFSPAAALGKKGQPGSEDRLYIEAMGLKVRSKILGVSKITNGDTLHLARMKQLGLKFMAKKDASFSMNNVLSMDLETCSVANTEGRFMVYAVGFFTTQLATSA